MNAQKLTSLALLAASAIIVTTANATLVVGVSPDNKAAVAAGSNRTFLRLNPETLEVTDRVWNGMAIKDMAYNRDGSVLLAADTGMGGFITFYDAKTLKRLSALQKMDPSSFTTACDLVAGIEGNRSDPTLLRIHSMTDGSEKMKIKVTPKRAVVAVGLNLEGTLAAVLYEGRADPAEEKLPEDKDLRGLDRVIDKQKKDGFTSLVEFYEIPSGNKLAEHTVFYRASGVAQAIVRDGKMMVVNYGNENAVIGQDGSVSMFQCANTYNYGIGFTNDHQLILTGGLADFSVTQTATLQSQRTQVPEKLPSWPEYFKGFSGNSDGVLLGATDGFRVFRMEASGACKLFNPAF